MSTDKNTDSVQKRYGPMMTSSQLNQKFKNSPPLTKENATTKCMEHTSMARLGEQSQQAGSYTK